ncbi:MAG: DUF4282 domain-containing protein [Chloroflexi bacterium]|nr:DUF4282 domain-containing protein [Chloroflexota bacterium]
MKQKRFLAALFDFSFSEFVTTKLIKVLYGFELVVAALLIIGVVIGAFLRSVGAGLIALVLSPVAFVLAALGARVWTELLIVIFRIAENTGDIAKANRE